MKAVDKEVRVIIDQQYALARRLLEENRDKVEAMTKALLEWETLDSDQIHDIMGGKPPRPPKPVAKPVPPPDSGGGGRAAEPTTTPVENA
jgi:cell division protease FtsH